MCIPQTIVLYRGHYEMFIRHQQHKRYNKCPFRYSWLNDFIVMLMTADWLMSSLITIRIGCHALFTQSTLRLVKTSEHGTTFRLSVVTVLIKTFSSMRECSQIWNFYVLWEYLSHFLESFWIEQLSGYYAGSPVFSRFEERLKLAAPTSEVSVFWSATQHYLLTYTYPWIKY